MLFRTSTVSLHHMEVKNISQYTAGWRRSPIGISVVVTDY